MEINKKIYEGNNLELKDTVEMMLSDDYKERFKAEFYQTQTRFLKLEEMVKKYKAGTLDFEPKSRLITLDEQLMYMYRYLRVLAGRAKREGIEL